MYERYVNDSIRKTASMKTSKQAIFS